MHLQRQFHNCCSLIIRISEVGIVGSSLYPAGIKFDYVLNGPLFSDFWRFCYCLVQSMGGYLGSKQIILYQGENLFHDSTWDLIRVTLLCRMILYCGIWAPCV